MPDLRGRSKDEQTRDFFQQGLNAQRQLADEGKQLLQELLQKDSGGLSVFGWESESATRASGNVQSTSIDGQTI